MLRVLACPISKVADHMIHKTENLNQLSYQEKTAGPGTEKAYWLIICQCAQFLQLSAGCTSRWFIYLPLDYHVITTFLPSLFSFNLVMYPLSSFRVTASSLIIMCIYMYMQTAHMLLVYMFSGLTLQHWITSWCALPWQYLLFRAAAVGSQQTGPYNPEVGRGA